MKNIRFRKRAGVSPVIATTIILGITVTLGLALFSFVNSQSNLATESFAQEATGYINFRNDRFVITDVSYKTNLCGKFINGTQVPNCVSAYVFNSGDVPITLNQVLIGNSSTTMQQYCIDAPTSLNFDNSTTTSVVKISPKFMQPVSFHTKEVTIAGTLTCSGQFSLPTKSEVFYINLFTVNGAYQTAFQKYNVGN